MTYDLLIKHGTVIDGTGAPGVMADVGVSGGRITAMAPHLEGRAGRAIDASGRIVAPGFIDVHTHSDFTLLSAPGADSKVRQGITTVEEVLSVTTAQYPTLSDAGSLDTASASEVNQAFRSLLMAPIGANFRPNFEVSRATLAAAWRRHGQKWWIQSFPISTCNF